MNYIIVIIIIIIVLSLVFAYLHDRYCIHRMYGANHPNITADTYKKGESIIKDFLSGHITPKTFKNIGSLAKDLGIGPRECLRILRDLIAGNKIKAGMDIANILRSIVISAAYNAIEN